MKLIFERIYSVEKQIIELTVAGKDIAFEPNIAAYNKLINDMSMDNKVSPAHNYLMRIVTAETKDNLADILKLPGAALQLVNEVNKRFAPELDIVAKN
ncbi:MULTISPECIES: putative phage tail assembly chaperone [Klebsiella/Raoultella group]|uniref:putative phage tail assembly chaperone n=1 Tax=Klebsiella/Raoultella group TaxID=2890311 RepID=UPI00374E0AFE